MKHGKQPTRPTHIHTTARVLPLPPRPLSGRPKVKSSLTPSFSCHLHSGWSRKPALLGSVSSSGNERVTHKPPLSLTAPASRVMSVSCHALHGYANIWMSLEATPAKDSAQKSSEEPHIVRAFKRQERLLLAAVYPLLVLLPQHIWLDLHRACGIPFRSLSVLTHNCMYQYSTATRVKWHAQ